ncbi:hypothetical protein CcaCcLH18_05280 [Colletotrichum camelliae]|nr:hypothetical protein CcaCcLH18_05280 [Colletotrichum camelliae]
MAARRRMSPVLAAGADIAAIGNTPLIPLRHTVPPSSASVFIKLETSNPTGSHKDRMAASIIAAAEARGALTPGMKVVEAVDGSTGTSLAFVCAKKGYPFHAFSSKAFAVERLLAMAALGAKVDIVPSERYKITAETWARMIEVAAKEVRRGEAFAVDQFHNRDALPGYEALGKELLEQVPGGNIDAFCTTVGTAGMAMGVSGALKAANPATKVVVLEMWASPAITHGRAGEHKVEGTGVGFVPPLLDRGLYDEVRDVDQKSARRMCRHLRRKEGIYAGLLTGLNVLGALELAKELGRGKSVVTVACDSALEHLKGVRTLVRSEELPGDGLPEIDGTDSPEVS